MQKLALTPPTSHGKAALGFAKSKFSKKKILTMFLMKTFGVTKANSKILE